MTSQSSQDPEIILYDLACEKNVCFSPAVWRIRLLLNYKKIPYKTIFLEFPDIEPTLKDAGIPPPQQPPSSSSSQTIKYTVPSIHHIPTNTRLMDSAPIAEFLNTTYPSPALLPKTPLCTAIETKARSSLGAAFRTSLIPRELHILSPRAQEYFRRSREAELGQALEALLDGGKEDAVWKSVGPHMREVGALMGTNSAEGPFLLGAKPCETDFFLVGVMEGARVVDEGVFERLCGIGGYRRVWEACKPWMEKND